MRVLIADSFETSGRDALAAMGCEVLYEPKLKDQSLVDAVRDKQPDVLVVRSTQVTEPMLEAGPLKLVVRAGAGYNTIDVAAASKRGVYVSNCPGKNSVAVAELAFGLILALDRRIADNVIALRAGQWNKTEYSKARGLLGRTLGIIGVGQIAEELITSRSSFRHAGRRLEPQPHARESQSNSASSERTRRKKWPRPPTSSASTSPCRKTPRA